MSVIRVRKDKNYFAASNIPFNDKNLSWEARGIMAYLLSKPDDWQVMMNDLANQGPAAMHKIRRILKELEEHGYLKRTRTKTPDGKFCWQSTVFEKPTISRKTIDGKTISRLSIDGETIDGKPVDIISTELISTELPSTDLKPLTHQQKLVGKLADMTGMDLELTTSRIGKTAKQLDKAGYTIDDLDVFNDWWYENDWRGQKKQAPNLANILEHIGKIKKIEKQDCKIIIHEDGRINI